MFYKNLYCKAVVVLAYSIVAQSFSVSFPTPPTEVDGCEDVDSFLNMLNSLPTVEAFSLLSSPLNCNTCCPEVKTIRSKLLTLVEKNIIDIKYILKDLQNIGLLNRYDVLISSLMAMNEFYQLSAKVRDDVTRAIFYLLKTRYLRINNFDSVTNGFCERRNNYQEALHGYGRTGSCACQTQLFEILLNRLSGIENRNPKFYSSNINALVPRIIPEQTSEGSLFPDFNFENLIKLLPIPKYPFERQMYEKFKLLLMSPLIQGIIRKLNFANRPDVEILQMIIKAVLENVTDEEVRQVFRFYINFPDLINSDFNYGSLIEALPKPQNEKEHQYNEILTKLLTGELLYKMQHSPEFKRANTLNEKLIIIFRELIETKTVSREVLEAIHYYLPLEIAINKNINFGNLVSLLPAPTNDLELEHFNILKRILNSNDLYFRLQGHNMVNLTASQQLFLILDTLIAESVPKEVSLAALYYRNLLLNQKYGFNYYNLLDLLNVPEESKSYISLISNYFSSPEFQMMLDVLKISSLTDTEKLLAILEAVQSHSTDSRVLQASQYLIQLLNRQIFVDKMKGVISWIPQPKTESEMEYYAAVTKVLLSDAVYQLLKTIDFSLFPNNANLLQYILKMIVDSRVDEETQKACEYYIDFTEKLEALELVTRKEIKKSFKLTEIFTDTLDLKSLTLPQKQAFKMFFRYIAEGQKDVMSNFVTWDQAKTRGEFMKLLFQYLLSSPLTLPEIKESILVLDSLVKMDGKGALPP